MVSRRAMRADHVADARAAVVLLEVAGDALLQVARLADVEHLALRVEVAVDAGQAGQRRHLGEQALALRGRSGVVGAAVGSIGVDFAAFDNRARCTGTCSAASSTTSATSACAGAWPPTWPRAANRCACGSTMPRRWPGWRRRAHRGVQVRRLGTPTPTRPATWWSRPSAATRRRPSSRAMARRQRPPLWINLEYLSAEAYVEAQPRPALAAAGRAGRGLDKWFFYPGFTPGTGGLLREPGLMASAAASTAAPGCAARPGAAARRAGGQPVLLRQPAAGRSAADAGRRAHAAAADARHGRSRSAPARRRLRCLALPWLTQPDFDHLLWACDLNFVRGEDSLRARACGPARPSSGRSTRSTTARTPPSWRPSWT